jgi:hypothetical protein
MFSKSMETGNVLSETESQGFREQRASAPKGPETDAETLRGIRNMCLNDASSRNSTARRKKGQLEGNAVKGDI